MTSRYLIILEPTPTGFSAHSPDVGGCATTGRTRQEAESNISEAIEFHFAGLLQEGGRMPPPRTEHAHVIVGAARR